MFDALETRLRRLEDRTEIGELVTRYCLTMDDRDVAAIPGLFSADAVVRSLDGVMNATGRDAIVRMFIGRFTVLGPSNHVTHDRIVRFTDDNPDEASGIVLSHAEMQRKSQPMLTAIRYLDRYRRDAGQWRFSERVLTFMYYVPTAEYLDAFGAGIDTRMRAYDQAVAADWPEQLPTWKSYYGT